MPRWLYTVLLYLLLPLILLRLYWRGRKAPAYRLRWRERFGVSSPSLALVQRPIWLHAVSVGETLAAQPLVAAIRKQWPGHPLLITTMTPTGSERVQALWSDSVHHVYAPYDFPHAISRFLDEWNPEALIIMETELWPNTLAAAKSRAIPVLLTNARLSEKSAKGYAKAGGLTRSLMQSLSMVAAQDQATADRFLSLGLPPEKVSVTGSVKFDLSLPDDLPQQAKKLLDQWRLHEREVWVAASTHDGEDEPVLAAHKQLLQTTPDALLILVPRHPERFQQVADLITQQGFNMARRSTQQDVSLQTQVLLADSMGELLLWLAMADVAFVGGSLVPVGGHNTLEPLALLVPTLTGPYFMNFQVINDALINAGALAVVENSADLADAILKLLNEPKLVAQQRASAEQVMSANRGAVQRQLDLLQQLIERTA
ncbi:MAG: lipid IV(A) 3-deoxy-D-manno-octulosonic acid transferase [Moraxellaceae bacterium]|nr:lipid IV(A) 3-deoxy-D-manno-octulosonic acid transferase [Moraxellaceae bacterium]MDZ4385608.1 lipid IV(A) 3-deoxy-D-manno-octulosonic acid transferase [Moraxellaceae bacterium]